MWKKSATISTITVRVFNRKHKVFWVTILAAIVVIICCFSNGTEPFFRKMTTSHFVRENWNSLEALVREIEVFCVQNRISRREIVRIEDITFESPKNQAFAEQLVQKERFYAVWIGEAGGIAFLYRVSSWDDGFYYSPDDQPQCFFGGTLQADGHRYTEVTDTDNRCISYKIAENWYYFYMIF